MLLLLSMFFLLYTLLFYSIYLIISLCRHSGNFYLRFISANLISYREVYFSKFVVIGSLLSIVLTVYMLQVGIFSKWQTQVPNYKSNTFIVGLQDSHKSNLSEIMSESDLFYYPVVRGNLIKQDVVNTTEGFGDPIFKRPINISESLDIPDGNKVVEGRWHSQNSDIGEVSVEQSVAKRLGLTIGSEVVFKVANEYLSLKVTSIRSVNWLNFRPNFYFLCSIGTLNKFPKTWLTSANIDNKQLIARITSRFIGCLCDTCRRCN